MEIQTRFIFSCILPFEQSAGVLERVYKFMVIYPSFAICPAQFEIGSSGT